MDASLDFEAERQEPMAFRLGSAAPLKRFYKYLLKRVIGSFLKRDIDLDQLEVQLWSGQVQLKNLELDVSALNVPGLRCSKAQLGCVKMLVPWRRLVSDHCKVYISGLHLTFTKADHRQALSPAEDSNPQGFFHEAPNRTQEESRYTEEGIETLSRLVKRVLARMEVCLHDLSVTVTTKPCLLRGRLSSVVLLSEDGEEHMKRSLRVGVVSLSMLSAEATEAPDEDASPHAGEVTFLSTRGQESVTAAAGVLDLGINNGVFFSSLQLPAIRLAFTEASCCMLSEALSSLSQALRRPAPMQMPDIEDLENNFSGMEPTYEEDPQPPMVQSLLFQSAMATGPGHFWQDLYSLFQADDELASAAGDQTMAVEGENAETDPQEEEAFLDVLEGEDAKGPMVKASFKVQVGNLAVALCFLPDQQDRELFSDPETTQPQPRLLPIDARPMQRPEHQGQLCLGGLSFSLDKKLTEPEEEPFWNFSADSLGVHLHQYQEDGEAEEEEEATPPSHGSSPAREMPIGRSLAASDMFRSAFSELPAIERPRTPSLASGSQCVTEESEGESESFGHSSVHSLSDEPNEEQEEEDEGLESDEDLHDAFFHHRLRRLLPRRAQERVAPALGARGQWQRSVPNAPFLSKQVLCFIDSESSGSSSGCRPPSPAPDPEHPIWITLGFQGLSQRRLWVATVEEAKARSIRFGCFPLEVDLCSASIKLLLSASRSRPEPGGAVPERFAGHGDDGEEGDAESPSGPSGARPGPALELGFDPDASQRQRFVAVAPAIRMVLRLTSGTSIVGDLVLPRLLAPALPEEQDAFSEAMRFDAASAMLYLSTPQEVTELLSLRAGPAPGFVHRNALELVVLTRQAPTPVSSPKEVPTEPEPSSSPPLTGWTRLTALRPSAPPPGNLHLPPSAEPNTEPKEPESSPDASLGGGEFTQKRCPTEVEMSVTGDVQFQIDISKICFLKEQASLFIAALTPIAKREELRPREMRPMHPVEQSLGWRISLGRVCLRIEETQELEDSRRQGSRVSAVQLCLTTCRCVNGSNFMAEDVRIECLVQDGSGREAGQWHTLLRPSSPERQPRGSDHCAEAGEVTLSSYLWQAFPRWRPSTFSGCCWCLEGSWRISAVTLQLRGLVFLCERPLLEQCVWLSQLQDVFKADPDEETGPETPLEPEVDSEARSLSVRIQLIDCFMDLPSKSSWNSSKQGEPAAKELEPLDETWRMVLEVTNLEGRIQTKAPHRGSLRSGRLEAYVSEGAVKRALEPSAEMNLLGMGFVPFFEISSASCSTAKEKEAELRLGRVQCHLRPDTARTLRRVANELSALLPAPQGVDMPEVMTQKAMPKDFDLSEEAFREATSSRFDDTDNDILANVDMFAFAPPPRTSGPTLGPSTSGPSPVPVAPVSSPQPAEPEPPLEAMTDALQNALGGAPDAPPAAELIRGSSASTTASCRVDEFIRAQELQQSPRSPVRACAPRDFEEGGVDFEMRLEPELPEALEEAVEEEEGGKPREEVPESAESSEVVAVCILDPEVVSEHNLRKLRDQEEMARQQMEQQFLEEVGNQAAAPPTPSRTKAEVRWEQDHSVLILDLDAEIIEDYFVRGELGNRRFEAPRWAPKPITVVRLHLDEFNLTVYEGSDFAAAWSDKDSLATDRLSRSHLTVHLGTVEAKYMQFPATLPRGVGARKLVDSSTLRCRLVLGVRDFAIQDRVHGSVFQRVLACFEDEEKKPRPSMSDMLYLRVDELVHGTSDQPDAPQEVAPEYSVELQILPLQLTVDQDTLKFAEEFWQDCCMSTYVEEPDGEDYVAQAGIVEENDDELHADPSQALNFGASPAGSSVPLFFQEVKVGSLFVAIDYKAKRIDTEALKRGELWQLVNALPILEGLEVRFTKVVVYQKRGLEKVLNEVAQCWGADLDRTQVLRCLSGITPIRSIANISGGFAEMVLDPLKQYLAGEDAEHVSRTMLRGVVSFLRHVTVESIDLTERVFVGAQAALEYANSRFTKTPASGSRPSDAFRSAGHLEADAGFASSSCSSSRGSEWLPVERGSANFMQPGGAAEGLQEAGSNLTQGLRNTGPILVKPFVEIKQGAPKKQVLQSVVSGIPVCILRPAIGVTSAAVPAIRGVRNRLDPSHRREMVRKYRGPG